jgi:NADPH2:quinone reductase
MRVVSCNSFAPVDQLVVEERPSPPLPDGHVRISVTACGVNFVDALIVQGLYQLKPTLPFVPGGEVAGTVAEVAADVTSHAVGDRVFVTTGLSGGFASEVVMPAFRVIPTPSTITDAQAATFVQSYCTAWFALHLRAKAQTGEWLLVLGAGGGVGLAAVDVGRAMGLRVIAAASSEAKRELALAHGAEAVIDTTTEDLKVRAKELSGGGVHHVYDPVGGAMAEAGLPNYTIGSWGGLFGPAGLPPAIVERLAREANAALARPEVLEGLARLNVEPQGSTTAEFAAFVRDQLAAWGKAVKDAGITPE